MRTNGFILIIFGFTTAALAGTSSYLPSVGPVVLRFAKAMDRSHVAALPPPPAEPQANSEPAAREEIAAQIPVEPPPTAPPGALMNDIPVVLPENLTNPPNNPLQALISPMMETNGAITPQMFLRFFTPGQGGASREAIVVPPTGFNPAQPPAQSSTATYSQPKP